MLIVSININLDLSAKFKFVDRKFFADDSSLQKLIDNLKKKELFAKN